MHMKCLKFCKMFKMKNCQTVNSSIVFYDKNNVVINNTAQPPLQINNIGKIDFNFVFFSTELEFLKKKILKDYFAKNYNAFAITFSQEINDYCKLTIRLYDAIKSNQQENTQTKGMMIDANFEQVIDEENTIWEAFNTNYNQLVEDYINKIV